MLKMTGRNVIATVVSLVALCRIPAVRGATSQYPEALECKYHPGYTVGNRTAELKCCGTVVEGFLDHWADGRFLTKYMEALEGWNCPQFEQECANRTVAFTPYYKLLYERFCNVSKLLVDCEVELKSLPLLPAANSSGLKGNESGDLQRWISAVSRIDFDSITGHPSECAQVAMYDSAPSRGSYYEVLGVSVPFCDLTSCGFDADWLRSHHVTIWSCASATCRGNIIATSVVLCLFAIVVIVANATVFYVVTSSPKMRHSQGIYKGSLALGDLLVGLFVFPTFVSTLLLYLTRHHLPAAQIQFQGYNVSRVELGLNSSTLSSDALGSDYSLNYPEPYLRFVGFFTALSIMVSIYSLMLAAFDRLWAVGLPLKFQQGNSLPVAKVSVGVLWIVAVFIGTLPLYLKPHLEYGLVASVLIAMTGEASIYFYLVAIATPMLVVWVVTLVTLGASRKHGRVRARMTRRTDRRRLEDMEARLAKTLYLMVSVFSASLLPTAVVLIVPFFAYTIYYSLPDLLDPGAAKVYTSLEFVAVAILTANSAWNCVIYSFRNPDFRIKAKRAYYDLFKRLGLAALAERVGKLGRSVKERTRRRSQSSVSYPHRSSMGTSVFTVRESPALARARRIRKSADIDSLDDSLGEARKSSVWRWEGEEKEGAKREQEENLEMGEVWEEANQNVREAGGEGETQHGKVSEDT